MVRLDFIDQMSMTNFKYAEKLEIHISSAFTRIKGRVHEKVLKLDRQDWGQTFLFT
jgi:hypothetical protein